MFNAKHKKIIFVIIFICSICTFFGGINQVEAKVDSSCIFCNAEADKIKKERQFATKIKIIKSVFKDKINAPVLAATVLYVNMDNGIDKYYEEDFNETDFRQYYTNLKSGLDTGTELIAISEGDGHKEITNSDIDLLTAATILMYFSTLTGDGLDGLTAPYNEEMYKKALLLDKGFTENAIVDVLLCSGASQTIFSFITLILNAFTDLNPFDANDHTFGDTLNYLTNMHNICEVGFLEATYHRVEAAEKEEVKDARKQIVVNHIFQLAELYEKWLNGSSGTTCVVSGASGDYASWKQYDENWASIKLGNSSSTIKSAGCLATSVSIQIARSGTMTTLPSGFSSFNPGALVTAKNQNNGFDGANFIWSLDYITPNFNTGRFVDFTDKNNLATELSKVLSEKEEGKYQRYVVLQIYKPTQHWVAVEGVQNGQVIINDPAQSGKTLDENYDSWKLNGYRIMWATDGTETSSSVSSSCTSAFGGSFADLLDFVAYVEGSGKCNNGNGYSAENLGDGAGMTTAFGITENYSTGVAKEVGYTNFLSDIRSGCTDKTYIDKMFPIIMERYVDFVTKKNEKENLGLSQDQIYILSSVAYNTGTAGSVLDIMETIKQNGINHFQTFNCMKTKGCSWTASGYNDGLVRRRMAEHEVLVTGNFAAAKPTKTYSYFQSINTNAKYEEYKASHWPTKR